MKKILITIPCLHTGGTEVACLQLAKSLISLGFSVSVVVYFKEIDPIMLNIFQHIGVDVKLLNIPRTSGFKTYFQLFLKLGNILRLGEYNLIWLQYMTPSLLPLLMARFFTTRLFASVHVVSNHYSALGIFRIRWFAYFWCSRFICVSNTVANSIFGNSNKTRWLSKKVIVIPNSLDMTELKNVHGYDWRKEMMWPNDAMIVGFVGRLDYIKGVDILIKAVAEISVPIRLIIIGDGAEFNSLRDLAEELGVLDITHFAGRISHDEIYRAIKGFDVGVVPSREEGFGLSALEMMAVGLPIIATRVDALNEVVIEGKTGLLFNEHDYIDLAEKIVQLFKNPILFKEIGTAAVTHVFAHYSQENYRNKVSKLILEAN